MKSLSINFSKTCNNKCIFCFCNEKNFKNLELLKEIDNFRKAAKEIIRYRKTCGGLIISGNEPTLNPDLFSIILFAKKLGYFVELRTNGKFLANEKYCLELLQTNFDICCISLLSYDAAIHDSLTKTKDSFKETVEGIKNVFTIGGADKIKLFNVITSKNYKKLTKYIEFCKELGVREVQFNFVYHSDYGVVPKLSSVEKYIMQAIKLSKKLNMRINFFGFPLCFLRKYYKLSQELYFNQDNNEVMLGGRFSDYNHVRKSLGKKKTKYCNYCMLEKICEGIWSPYLEIYGEKEFKKWGKKMSSQYDIS